MYHETIGIFETTGLATTSLMDFSHHKETDQGKQKQPKTVKCEAKNVKPKPVILKMPLEEQCMSQSY